MIQIRATSTVCPLLATLALFQISCSNIATNAKENTELRMQASDGLTGARSIAQTAFRATAVATLREPVTTVRLGLSNLWHRPMEILNGNLPVDLDHQPVIPEIPGTPEFEKRLDREGFPRAESGTLRWLVDGPGFFPELDRQIAAATRSINLQIFIFDNDDIAVRYADVLKSRAWQVPVHVLFDDLGSTFAHSSAPLTPAPPGFVPPADMARYLRRGSKVRARRTLNPWLTCDHTKLLVFDHRTAIIGGMNLGREYYSEWHDLMVKVEGPVVAGLSRDFSRAWRKAGGWGDFALWFRQPAIFRRAKPLTGGIPLRVLRTDPAEGRYEIRDSLMLALQGARRRILIENPYFASDEIATACAAAARRGVDVTVILPAAGDSIIMDAGNVATARSLIESGVKVYRYPKMAHLKVTLCDDWASVGSANLDTLSLRINRELNLAFSDRHAVKSLEEAVFRKDLRVSRRLRLAETESTMAGLAEAVADQL